MNKLAAFTLLITSVLCAPSMAQGQEWLRNVDPVLSGLYAAGFLPERADDFPVLVPPDARMGRQYALQVDPRDETLSLDLVVLARLMVWETAVMLPLTVERVEWALVRNMDETLNAAAEVAAGIDGRLVRMEM